MKLPWRKIAAAGGFACAAAVAFLEWRRPIEPVPPLADPTSPVVALAEPAEPWQPATELDDETAGIDPDALLPAKLQLTGHAADLEFAAASAPVAKPEGDELKNPSRDELLLHIARNARKRKDYDESAKFYKRTMELQKTRADIHYEYAEMLAEAGKAAELKAELEMIDKAFPAKDDAARKRVADLKDKDAKGAQPAAQPSASPPSTATEKKVTAPGPRVPGKADAGAATTKSTTKTTTTTETATTKQAAAKKAVAKTSTKESPARKSEPTRPTAVGANGKRIDVLDPPAPVPAVSGSGKAPPPAEEVVAAPQPFHPPSLEDFARAIAANPDDATAKLGLARLKLENWRCGEAGDLLADASPKLKDDREYRLTVAWRHAILGEYSDAKCLLQRLLEECPNDPASILALADLFFLAKDYQRALSEYGKIAEGRPESDDALLGAANALMELGRYDDAFLVCNRRLAAHADNPEALILLTETLRRNGKLDEALSRCKAALASLPPECPAVNPIRLQYAKLLLYKGRTADARCEFEQLALTAFGNHPIVVWGLWAFPGKANPKKERAPAPPVPPEDVNFAVTVSDFMIELGNYGDAASLLEQASAASPSDLLLLIRLGDARSRLRIGTGRYSAMDAYMRALTLSPNNCHAMYGYAKAARHAGLLPEALDAADKLIALDANDVPARLEKARTLYAMQRFAEADAVYAQAAGTPVEEQLRRELGRLCEQLPPDRQQVLMPALQADGPHLRQAMLAVAQQDAVLHDDLVRLSADYDAAQTMRGGFARERSVKAFTDWAPIRGIDAGIHRLETQPLDDEAAYDLGRNYSRLHATREAEKYYHKVMATSPNHYAAGVALDRLDLEQGPKATLDGDYFRERGRNGLTEIDRYRLQGWGAIGIGDEDEYIAAGAGFLRLKPTGAPSIDGNVSSVRAQYKPVDLLLLYGQINGESYDQGFRDRLTYDLGAAWRASDCLRVYAGGFRNNVAENAESIRQDVHRDGLTAGLDYSPNRCDDFGGSYRWADYSDGNQLHELFAYASHHLCFWPDELKLIGDVHYWSYNDGTIFPAGAPADQPLFGTVHPYFAPNGYAIFAAHLEWTKALCGDTFKEADLTWIGLRGGAGVDTDGVPFAFARATFHRDLCYWLSFHTELGYTESRVYRDLSAYGYLTARLRKLCKTCWATSPSM